MTTNNSPQPQKSDASGGNDANRRDKGGRTDDKGSGSGGQQFAGVRGGMRGDAEQSTDSNQGSSQSASRILDEIEAKLLLLREAIGSDGGSRDSKQADGRDASKGDSSQDGARHEGRSADQGGASSRGRDAGQNSGQRSQAPTR